MQIIYTAQLGKHFDKLPRIFNQIRQLRQPSTLLLDLGGVYSSEQWLCRATDNRAPYLVLDAMGYHVAYADGLTTGAIIGLQPQTQVRLLDNSVFHRWQWHEWLVNVGPTGLAPCVTWALDEGNTQPYHAQDGRLTLYPYPDHIGCVTVQWPEMSVQTATFIPYDFLVPPDPTIVAAIEFIEREARFYEQKQRGYTPHES